MGTPTKRTYSELLYLPTYNERLQYLRLDGTVGAATFGHDRFFNQKFYISREWRRIRNYVISRDNGCDLGIPGMEIDGKVTVHHMNPITVSDITDHTEYLFDPEFLITVSYNTHNAIHFGTDCSTFKEAPERFKNDTCPWKT